jgi:hypothetical protein
MSSHGLLCVCVSVLIPSYKDISHVESGPTIMTLLYLQKQSHAEVLGYQLQHMNVVVVGGGDVTQYIM